MSARASSLVSTPYTGDDPAEGAANRSVGSIGVVEDNQVFVHVVGVVVDSNQITVRLDSSLRTST